MKYNILGFDQEKLIEVQKTNSINGNDVIVLRTLVDLIRKFDNKVIVDGNEFTRIKYDALLADLPFVTDKIDTLKKIVTKLRKAGLVKQHIVKKAGTFTYFRVTDLLISIEYKVEGKPAKKKDGKKKTNIDSNGQEPLKGQITVEEAIAEVETTGVSKEVAKEALNIAENREGVKDAVAYAKTVAKNIDNNKVNAKSFNNFEAREYNYNKLENMLLGWEEYSEEEVSEVLAGKSGSYTNNNKKRFSQYGIAV